MATDPEQPLLTAEEFLRIDFGSDMGVRTHDRSIRYPDVSAYCSGRTDPANDALKAFDDPRVIIEVLSPSTRRRDYGVKLDEYREIPSIDTIVFVDPSTECLRIMQRTSPNGWSDESFTGPADLPFPSLDLTMPHGEIFARD